MKTLLRFSLITIIVFAGFKKANATTYTWTGSTSALWSVATNWLPNGHPTATDDIIIGTAVRGLKVDIASFCQSITVPTVGQITLAAPLSVSGGLLMNAPFNITVGTSTFSVAGAATLVNNTSLIIKAGTTVSLGSITTGTTSFVSNASILNCNGTSSIGPSSYFSNTGTFNLAGDVSIAGGSYINNVSGTLSLTGSASINMGLSSFMINTGTFKLNTGSVTFGTNSFIDNRSGGNFTTNGAMTINLKSRITNEGTFTINSGAVYVGVNSYIQNAASSTFIINGAVINMDVKGQLSNSGTCTLSGTSIKLGSTGFIYNLTGGTVTLNGGSTIDFAANSAAGAYVFNAGTFYGGTSNSGATFNLNYSGVYLQNNGTFYLGSASVVNLTGANTAVRNTGTFTLQSDISGSATIGNISGGSAYVIGTYNVERYISGGSSVYRTYRLLSSPVYQSAIANYKIYSLNYVQLSSLITGPGGPANGFDKAGNPTLYLFRENIAVSNTTFTGGNYRGISSLTNPLSYSLVSETGNYNIPTGSGFFFFFRGDRTTNLANKYTAGTSAESVTLTATGKVNTGQITVHDWYTPLSSNLGWTNTPGNSTVQGLSLVGNPYPSSIDWDTYNSTTPNSGIYAPNVSSSIYILDPVTKNYGVYSQSSHFGTNNATHVIPSGQAFFVQAFSPSASLTFNEDAKVNLQVVAPNLFLGTPVNNSVAQYIHLKLNQDGAPIDEAYINFKSGAKPQFEPNDDVIYKPGYGAASMATVSSDGYPLIINTLALPKSNLSIPVNVSSELDGTYQLSVPEIKSIPKLYDVWMMDALKKDSLNMRVNKVYNIDIDKSNAASFGSNRLSILIRQNPIYAYHLLNFSGSVATTGIQLVWKTENEGNYTRFTIEKSTDNGQTFDALGGVNAADQGMYGFTDINPVIGFNKYRLKQEDINGLITYSTVVIVKYMSPNDNVAAVSNINIYPNPARAGISLNIKETVAGAYDIKIISNTGTLVKSATTPGNNWQTDVSSLLPGTYIIQVRNSSSKTVVGKTTFVKL